MTPSTRLRSLATLLRDNRLDLFAREADAIAVLVARMEVALDEITADAQGDARLVERGGNVVQLRPRCTTAGSDWVVRREFER